MPWRRLISKWMLARQRSGYHSRFGGLWTDRVDAEADLERRLRLHQLSDADAALVRSWRSNGYVILPGAVPHAVIDAINAAIEAAWRTRDARVKLDLAGEIVTLAPEQRGARCKILDFYAFCPQVLQAMFAPRIRAFLKLVFDADPFAFQSLNFEHGTEQEMHQDTAYVVVDSPMEMAASWIALEDIEPGTGELVYYVGSHRLAEFRFRGRYRNFNRAKDGAETQRRYLQSLHDQSRAMGLEKQTFRPRKGDALIWSADLVHGGSKVEKPGRTRRSLVTHYCPVRCAPYYFAYLPDRRLRLRFGDDCHYASSHYKLAASPAV